jgi:hypothetical protein
VLIRTWKDTNTTLIYSDTHTRSVDRHCRLRRLTPIWERFQRINLIQRVTRYIPVYVCMTRFSCLFSPDGLWYTSDIGLRFHSIASAMNNKWRNYPFSLELRSLFGQFASPPWRLRSVLSAPNTGTWCKCLPPLLLLGSEVTESPVGAV